MSRHAVLVATFTLLAGPALAARGDFETARVSAVEGSLHVRAPWDDAASDLAVNDVLRGGDEIFTDLNTFAELELPGETFLRLAPATTVVLDDLREDGVDVALADGTVYVSRGGGSPPVRVATHAGPVDVSKRSVVRVATDSSRSQLDVSVARGEAEVALSDATMTVEEDESLFLDGPDTERGGFDATRGDAFDRWSESRERLVRGRARPSQVGYSMMGLYELDGWGEWRLVDGAWGWCPSHLSSGWRPYGQGYWRWCDPWGWSWVDREPWGYSTCHYGRWSHDSRLGWMWFPDRTWGSAWVVWSAWDGRVGWAPCDFHGRPVTLVHARSYYDYRTWSWCEGSYLRDGGGSGRCRDCRPHRSTTSARTRYAGPSAPAPVSPGSFGAPALRGRAMTTAIRPLDPEALADARPLPIRDPRLDLPPRGLVTGPRSDATGTDVRRRSVVDATVETPSAVSRRTWDRGASETVETPRTRVLASPTPDEDASAWLRRGSSRSPDAPVMTREPRAPIVTRAPEAPVVPRPPVAPVITMPERSPVSDRPGLLEQNRSTGRIQAGPATDRSRGRLERPAVTPPAPAPPVVAAPAPTPAPQVRREPPPPPPAPSKPPKDK